MIVYNNQAPSAVNNVGQFGATEGSIGAYKQAAEYAADAKYWALLSQTKYNSVEDILSEVERLYAQGRLLEEDIKQLKADFEDQNQVLLGLIQSTGTAIDNTNAATELSKEATQKVLDQLDIISNMTVQTTLLPPGSLATGSYDNATGVFSFGIPEGRPGRDGTDGTISDIGSVPVGVPVVDDYGFYVDKDDGGLYRANMSEIADLVPSVRSVSINGGPAQVGEVSFDSVTTFNGRKGLVVPSSGDYSVSQITGAASSGDNSDITSLSGLTTALSLAQGGTGATSTVDARVNLGLGSVSTESIVPIAKGGTGSTTASGARANLGLGLTSTENIIPITKGGTGSTSAENARMALVAAKNGDNYDITSLNSLTTALSLGQGGTGATSPSQALENLGAYPKSLMTKTVLSVNDLRSLEFDYAGGQMVYVKGYYNTTPGFGGGLFIAFDGDDPDDGVFTFVTPGGTRWKRVGPKTDIPIEFCGVSSSRTSEQNSEAILRLFSSLPATGATVRLSGFYNIKYGVIVPPRVSLVGVGRDSCGFIKTGNDIRVVPDRNWGSSPTASYSVDFILAIDIDSDPNGDLTGNQTRSTRFEGFSLKSTASARVEYGIYSYISYLVVIKDLFIHNVNTGYKTQDSWLQSFSNVIIDGVQDGFVISGGGTSFDLRTIYVKNSSRWAFYLNNITYSSLTCCAVDYCYGTAYVMLGCTGVSLNGCGAEEIHGSLFEVNGSRVSINAFRSVNVFDTGSVAATFTSSAVSFDSSLLTEFVVPSGSKYWQFNGTTINLSNTVEPGAGRVSWGVNRSFMNYTDYRGVYTVIGDTSAVSDGIVTAGVINLYRSVPPDASVTSFPVGTTWTLTTPLAGNVYKYVYTSSGWKYASTLSS